jgi:hypothetical protein
MGTHARLKRIAIPTRYNGTNFRSRLEARWAAFFDLLGWNWEYEAVDRDGWIPDFLVMGSGASRIEPVLVEVKPITFFDRTVAMRIERSLKLPEWVEDFDRRYTALTNTKDTDRLLAEVRAAGPTPKVLLCGATLIEPDDSHRGAIGWAWYCGEWAVAEPRCYHSTNPPVWTVGPNGPFIHDYINGFHAPARLIPRVAFEKAKGLWREAGNMTQWRAP